MIVVSTRGIRWILWFSVHYAAVARREIFGINALRWKLNQLDSPNLEDIFIGGEASLGLKLASFWKTRWLLRGFLWKLCTFFYWLVLIGRRLNLFIGDMYRGGTSTNNSGRLLADKNSTQHRSLTTFSIHHNRKWHPIWRLPLMKKKYKDKSFESLELAIVST